MIVISGTIGFAHQGARDAVVTESQAMQRDTRSHAPGCLAYVFTADPVEPTIVHVYEAWQDEAALAMHFAGPRYSAMRSLLRAHPRSGPSSVTKHEVSYSEPVYDADGQPHADWFTR